MLSMPPLRRRAGQHLWRALCALLLMHDKQTGHYKYVASDYAAVQKPRNPDYYSKVGAGGAYPTVVGGTSQYDQRAVNNGQRQQANTHVAEGITAHYHNGYEQVRQWSTFVRA